VAELPEFDEDEIEDGDEAPLEATVVLPLAKDEHSPIPALREVRAQMVRLADESSSSKPATEEEQSVVLLEDPEGLAPKNAVLSMWAYAMSSLFDGRRSALDVIDAFAEKFKQEVDVDQVLDLQRELDKAQFLYSTNFEQLIKRQLHDYLNEKTRPMTNVGSSYPADPAALRDTVSGFFTAVDGPGTPPQLALDGVLGAAPERDTLRSLVLPHIDLKVGGATYAHGYAELLKNCEAELFIILGVAHNAPGNSLYYVSQKDFATPAGIVRTDPEVSRRLHAATGIESAVSELAHRGEHSIEFQAVLLATILEKSKRDFQIVPVLCGSIEPFLQEEADPFESETFQEFVTALRKELDETKKKWCVICSVDLCHVGPDFGHSAMIDERLLPPVERYDRKLLKMVEKLDPHGFYQEIARTQNSRHVDAVLSVMTMLKACEGKIKTGKLLHYDQLLKEKSHSAVSYASLSFEQ
jgi:MEMO1 family protein